MIWPSIIRHCQHGNMAFLSLHHVSTFWIELHTDSLQSVIRIDSLLHRFHIKRVLLVAIIRISFFIQARVNAQIGIIPFFCRFAEYRKHSREHCVHAPIRHIASICPHFIKTRTEERIHFHVTMCLSLFVNIVFLSLYHITTRIQQLNIQHFTQVCRVSIVRTCHICLEPYRLPLKITSIVKMHIHLLLWYSPVETHYVLNI